MKGILLIYMISKQKVASLYIFLISCFISIVSSLTGLGICLVVFLFSDPVSGTIFFSDVLPYLVVMEYFLSCSDVGGA